MRFKNAADCAAAGASQKECQQSAPELFVDFSGLYGAGYRIRGCDPVIKITYLAGNAPLKLLPIASPGDRLATVPRAPYAMPVNMARAVTD